MTAFFFVILSGTQIISSKVAVDDLPPHIVANSLDSPWEQGEQILSWMGNDLSRAKRIVSNIGCKSFDQETTTFLSNVLSFWENLPPAVDEKCGFFAIANSDQSHFIRTSLEVATDMFKKMNQIGD